MILADFIKNSISKLGDIYQERESRSIVLRLLTDVCNFSQNVWITDPQMDLDAQCLEKLESALIRLAKGEPLQYVTGFEEFCGKRFEVGPGVLIPRPESEELVMWVDSYIAELGLDSGLIVDAGSGSGALGISLGLKHPCWRVVGCDISERAKEFSTLNSEMLLGRDSNYIFEECNILSDDFEKLLSRVLPDILVSNPPYVTKGEMPLMRKNVLDYEPHLALFVEDDDPLLFYRVIAQKAYNYLSPGGALFYEINEKFGEEIIKMLEGFGYSYCEIRRDIFDKERMVMAKK